MIVVSNWNEMISFVGINVLYWLYFKDVFVCGSGCFFGIGINIGVLGVYFVSVVCSDGVLIGVVVVKISVDLFELVWCVLGVVVMVVDSNGVVVILIEFVWKFIVLCLIIV